MAKVFNVLAKHGIIIDLIATSEVNISMSVENIDSLDSAVAELEALGSVYIRKDLAILSLVGRGQKHCVGLAGKMFSVLGKEGINIEMISQGASEINISCVIDDRQTDNALQLIHDVLVA
jgi:aspartate kinase